MNDQRRETGRSHRKSSRLEVVKDVVGIAQGLATIFGIILAGWWFLFQGLPTPRVNLELSAKDVRLDNDRTLLYIAMKLVNAGNRPVHISNGGVQIRQLLLNDGKAEPRLNAERKPLNVYNWPEVTDMTLPYEMRLEPGETDYYYFESIVPAASHAMRIYGEAKDISLTGSTWAGVIFYEIGKAR